MKTHFTILKALALSLMFLVQACKLESEFEKQQKREDEIIRNFIQTNGINAERHALGYYFSVLESNSSGIEVKEGDIVKMKYKLRLLDGKVVEDIFDEKFEPAIFRYSRNSIFPADMLEGVGNMRHGERFRFIIPSYMAHRRHGLHPYIPSDAILDFEVEVLDVMKLKDRNDEEDAIMEAYIQHYGYEDVIKNDTLGFYYVRLTEGSGRHAEIGDVVSLHFTGSLMNDSIFTTTRGAGVRSLTLGRGAYITSFETGLIARQKGETGFLLIPSRSAFRHGVLYIPELTRKFTDQRVPPYSIVKFDLEVLSVELPKKN
jgi:FKBP-type peptidyl-prolyl cis-trans isomerase FkpA